MMKYIFFISTLILVRTFSFGQAQKFDFFDGTDNQTSGLMRNAKNQIEKVRKGNLMLEFINQSGKKVNAHAVIEQQAHDFDFGADLYGFHSMSDNDPAKAMALKAIDTLFNTVIICDYWGVNQNKLDGSHNWDSPDYGFKIANELAKKPRYHALIYGFPHWLDGFSEEELWGKIEDRIKHVADKYGDLITEVDVINEFINYQYWDKNPHAKYLRTTKFPDFAKPENGLRVLQIARKYLPKAKLVVLESAIWSANNPVFQEIYNYHKYLVEHNAPYDYIGYQAHYYAQGLPFQEGTPEFGPRTFMMDEIEKGLDQMAKLGKPIVITEFNPPSRSNESKNPNPPGISDEEVAAWETNFYTLLFSKPYINGISRWFTVDNLGGKGMDAGVVTENGKLKPNYFALKRLIKDKWHTKWEGHVHENVAFEGFYGTYKVTIHGYEEVKVSLTKENNKQLIKLEKR